MLLSIWQYMKSPTPIQKNSSPFVAKLKLFGIVLAYTLLFGLLLEYGLHIFHYTGVLDFKNHATYRVIERYPLWQILWILILLSPLLEEFFFRWPLRFFTKNPFYSYACYWLLLFFALYHLANFEINAKIFLLAPILIAPQLVLGTFLTYIRVHLNIWWSVALHGLYNICIFGPMVMAYHLQISYL